MSELAEASHIVGHRYVILPSLRPEHRSSLDAYKRSADMFNEIGAQAVKQGIRFAYHNHGYGFTEIDGQIPIHVLLDRTDPALVDLQMDIYWTTVGGADPIELLKRVSQSLPLAAHQRYDQTRAVCWRWRRPKPVDRNVPIYGGCGRWDI